MILHLLDVTFRQRTGRTVFMIVYDPQEHLVVQAEYGIPRTLEKQSRIDALTEVLLDIRVETLEALKEEIAALDGTIKRLQTKHFAPLIAAYYRRGAPVWEADWNPDDEGRSLDALNDMRTPVARRADIEDADEEDDEAAPRLFVLLKADGTVQVAHELDGTTLDVHILRERPDGRSNDTIERRAVADNLDDVEATLGED